MATSPVSSKPSSLSAEEESALVSQVVEIISGITLGALQTLDQPEDRDAWSMEEGDDSVFYSDEDQTLQDTKANASSAWDSNEAGDLVENEAEEPIPAAECEAEEVLTEEEHFAIEKDVTLEPIQTEEPKEVTVHKKETDSADSGAEAALRPENSVRNHRAPLQTDSSETALQVKEELVKEAQTAKLKLSDEKSHTRLTKEDKLQKTGKKKAARVPERGSNFSLPSGFHQVPKPGYSSLPLPNKSSDIDQKTFNHLSSSSKYGSLSYRKIRRGNTRQKIQQFEYMVMNL